MTHQEKDALRTELRGTQQALLAKAGEVVRLEDEVERLRAQLRDVAERQRAACAEWIYHATPLASRCVDVCRAAPLVTEERKP
jgi:chromosome segregation ATPase